MVAEQEMTGMTLKTFIPRPGYGTQGKALKVKANLFPVRFKGTPKKIYHYDFVINPVVKVANQKKPAALLRAVYNQLAKDQANGQFAKQFGAMAFDGRQNAFSTVPFTQDQTFEVGLQEQGSTSTEEVQEPSRRFKVVFREVNQIDSTQLQAYCKGELQAHQVQEVALTAIMAVNVLLRDDPSERFTPVGGGGNRFFGLSDRVALPQGATVGKGFFQSFRPTNLGYPAINLDTAYTAFVQEGPLINVAKRILGLDGGAGGGFRGGRGGGAPRGRGGFQGGGGGGGGAPLTQLSPPQINNLKRILKGARFTVSHRNPNQVYSLLSISLDPANRIKFRDANQREMTVVQYFKEQYNITLNFPGLPCVQYKKNMVPFELVAILPNHSIPPTRLSSDQTAEMIKHSALPPPQRMAGINNWRKELDYSRLPKIAAWGLDVSPDMLTCDARVLMPPRVGYGNNQTVNANNGSWNLMGKKFFKPGKNLVSWSVISFDGRMMKEEIEGFMKQFVGHLVQVGVPIAPTSRQPPVLAQQDARELAGVQQGLKKAAALAYTTYKANPQLIIVILPSRDKVFYEEVKRSASLSSSFRFRLSASRGNVSMKVQLKMGGHTHQIGTPDLPGVTDTTIIFGADVTHPPVRGGGDSHIPPSIVAVVATLNGQNNSYRAEVRLQEGRTEIIQDMKGVTVSLLRKYRVSNANKPPSHIIFYRDGVSEGQYEEVGSKEIKAIRDACAAIDPKYRPKLTYIICGKRHHIRFFGGPNDVDRSGNLPAGTVVDKSVTHPFAFDWYHQAHSGLVGTARSAHYICLVDDSKFTPDNIQKLTNNLSYQFARATRSVSLVPPAYYADVICTQIRPLVYSLETLDDSTQASGGTGGAGRTAFDPMKVQTLLNKSDAFNGVQWYM
ncbi:Piwi domain-containing protein [Mrakia frigida]|uniref:argonaute/piwi family protein n=1 Tax=Mrakia frigida TaxID=29902 RepID=UPI003FCC0F9B